MPEKLWFWLFWEETIIGLVLRTPRTRLYFVMATYIENNGVLQIIIKKHNQKPYNSFWQVIKQEELKCFYRTKATTVKMSNRISLSFTILFDYFSLHNIHPTLYFIYLWVSGQSSSALMQVVTAKAQVKHEHYHQQQKLGRWRRHSTFVTSSTGHGWEQQGNRNGVPGKKSPTNERRKEMK